MLDFHTRQTSETQLAVLLAELLEKEGADGVRSLLGDVPPEIVELRDMARLLRAASFSVPLPEGRHAVRRVLLATVHKSRPEEIPVRAAWRRTGRWLGMAAILAMIVGVFGPSTGLLDRAGSRSSPLHGLRPAANKTRIAGHAPAAVIGYQLTYWFPGGMIPAVPGEMARVEGNIGGLPVTLSLTASAGCSQGKACGAFMGWVTSLTDTRASVEFGQMGGTFVCAAGRCRVTLASKTGIFTKISTSVLPVNTAQMASGLVETAFASSGDWVATVQHAATKLDWEGLLPAGVTVADLASEAATNQSAPKRAPQDRTDRTPTNGSARDTDAKDIGGHFNAGAAATGGTSDGSGSGSGAAGAGASATASTDGGSANGSGTAGAGASATASTDGGTASGSGADGGGASATASTNGGSANESGTAGVSTSTRTSSTSGSGGVTGGTGGGANGSGGGNGGGVGVAGGNDGGGAHGEAPHL